MFGLFKKKTAEEIESELVQKYKADNLKLISKVGILEGANKTLKDEVGSLENDVADALRERDALRDKVADLEAELDAAKADDGKKVTYASARKTMTKAKLKEMRKALEAVPSGANFGGSVLVYDNKTKKLRKVTLESKAQALEVLSQAEKGSVDIVV